MGTGNEGASTAHAILLVEDDPLQGEALALLLGARGYVVTVAASGTEALALLAAGLRPCLLVLDLGLPDMHGLEFMRQHGRDTAVGGPAVPVILYSSFTDVAYHARESGAVAGVTKPDMDRLIHFVALHC
jgi:CheY-like chemotaxis protein